MRTRLNVEMIFSPDGKRILFEAGESDEEAACRELEEETGIGRDSAALVHVMDFLYYKEDMELQVWAGQLEREVPLREEENPLFWLSAEEDFFDSSRFAGEGNIGHILREVRIAGIPRTEK